ncbi:hypothetical protein [Salinivibrio kushneri]|uniref:Uncharacterized protein n=1 Tax=Salinivibrio kushneri TaxID=1908198 RepID=A0AA47LQM7_9GAMM|nr:hypothetical protein [Salinivibrio kushneri]WBA07879.1 hypothetical protein N8M53_08490 [Salinivibrio kushneri]
MDVEDLIYFYYLSGNYKKVIDLALSIKDVSSISKKYCDLVTKSMILEEHDYLHVTQSLWFEKSSSKLKTEFFLSRCMLKEGMKEKTNRDMSALLDRLYPTKFKQSLSDVDKSERLHILNSWGPGDDLRFSIVIDVMISLGYKLIIFHTEPRLVPLLSSLYPEVSVEGTYRSKTLSYDNFSHFDKVSPQKLHHVLDNDFFEKIGEISQFTLITNLLHDVLLKPVTFSEKRKLSVLNKSCSNTINEFFSGFKSNQLIVGISWRSMNDHGVRGKDYLSITDVVDIFEGFDNIVLISLQYDNCEKEVRYFNQASNVRMYIPPIDQMNDFSSVVTLMNQLNLIICTGNSVLEFAGCSATETLAVLLDPVQTYRFDKGKDIWFDNISILEDPKHATLTSTKKLIRNRLKRLIDKNENC